MSLQGILKSSMKFSSFLPPIGTYTPAKRREKKRKKVKGRDQAEAEKKTKKKIKLICTHCMIRYNI